MIENIQNSIINFELVKPIKAFYKRVISKN